MNRTDKELRVLKRIRRRHEAWQQVYREARPARRRIIWGARRKIILWIIVPVILAALFSLAIIYGDTWSVFP
jgi:hypothetical protein